MLHDVLFTIRKGQFSFPPKCSMMYYLPHGKDMGARPKTSPWDHFLAPRARGGQGGQGSGQGGPGGQRERGWDPLGPPEEKVFDMFENSQKPSGQHELC